jgi:hypothetical protein
LTPTGKIPVDRTTIWGLLKNPAYKGQAAFGKTRAGEWRPRLRVSRGRPPQPRRARSHAAQPPEHWLSIPVPALIDEALFDTVRLQLEENRRRARSHPRGAKYLLQGLLVCRYCGYAFYGKPISPSTRKHRPREYAYYRCVGNDAYRFGGQRLCDNPQVRTDRLEQTVWREVCRLLAEPTRLAHEYQRRLEAVQGPAGEASTVVVDRQIAKLRQGIARLIDGYAEGYLEFGQLLPLLERARRKTKPRTVELYEVFCAVLYLPRTGCQWRALPSDFPKWRTVHSYFAQWSEPGQDGVSLLERALKNGSTWISDSSDGYATNSCRRGLSTPPTMLLKRVDLRRERVSPPINFSSLHKREAKGDHFADIASGDAAPA